MSTKNLLMTKDPSKPNICVPATLMSFPMATLSYVCHRGRGSLANLLGGSMLDSDPATEAVGWIPALLPNPHLTGARCGGG